MKSAETLYGVTMEEPGISKTVSVQWDEIPKGKPRKRAPKLKLEPRREAEMEASTAGTG